MPLRRLDVDCTILTCNSCAQLGLQAVEETLKLKVTEHLHHVLADKGAQYTAHRKRRAEGEPAEGQESKGAKLPSSAARGAVDDLELSESEEYSSDEPSSDSSDEYM